MDTKRSQSMRKVATPQPSKSRMPPKTQSQASVTPSQASETARLAANGEKNPLDALSRNTTRPAYERRSGLQDIDEEYLKRVTMPPQTVPRNEHAAGKRSLQQPPTLQGTNLARNVGGAETAQQQPAQQTNQQQMQQPAQPQQMNMTQEQLMAQTQAQQSQQAQDVGVSGQQTLAQPRPADMQPQQMRQQQPSPQQVNYMQAAGEPEMCTTCPHCQTTIYLARVPEVMPIQTVAGIHGQPEGAGLAAAKQ